MVIDANVYWLPEELFTDPEIREAFLRCVPREYDVHAFAEETENGWAFRIDASHSMVRSSDAVAQWRPERDKSFQSFVNEVSLIVEFTFLDFYTGRKGNSISPYLFGGGSAFTYKTAPLLNADEMVALAGDQLPANLRAFEQAWKGCLGKGNSYSIPFGFGCKVSLSEHLATNIEWKMNYTFTDAIDGLEDVYSDAHAFANVYCKDKKDSEGNLLKDKNGAQLKEYLVAFQPLAEEGYSFVSSYDLTDQTGLFGAEQQMSNSQSKDWLGSITISLTWKIPIPGGGACRVNHY